MDGQNYKICSKIRETEVLCEEVCIEIQGRKKEKVNWGFIKIFNSV
jgi:hypothetical protein